MKHENRMHWILIILSVIGLVFLSGCIDIKIIQKLNRDIDSNHKLIIETEVSDSDYYLREANEYIKKINCKFNAVENKIDNKIYLTYTSDDCLLDEEYVHLTKVNNIIINYTINTKLFDKYEFSNAEVTFYVDVPGKVVGTNGIKTKDSQVKFLISDDDVSEGVKYYVEYKLKCLSNNDCLEDEECLNDECVKLQCGECSYIKNHRCIYYECCSDTDCTEDKRCVNNKCVPVPCECGYVTGHSCIKYECCSNEDCGNGRYCENHMCYDIECKTDNDCESYQICKKYNCQDLNCAEDEIAENHECKKLECGLLQKPDKHECVTNFGLVIIIVVILLGLIIGLIVVYGVKTYYKKDENR